MWKLEVVIKTIERWRYGDNLIYISTLAKLIKIAPRNIKHGGALLDANGNPGRICFV